MTFALYLSLRRHLEVMTLEILEGTPLDLGPTFWAIAVLIAVLIIEFFEMGPHQYAGSSKKGRKRQKKVKSVGPGGGLVTPQKEGGMRRRFKQRLGPIDKVLFRDCVVNVYYFGERDYALLYLGPGGEELDLRPKPPKPPEYDAAAVPETAPSAVEMDNYVIAWGEDPEVIVIDQLGMLWSVQEDRSDARYLVLYCSREPSTYAVQCIAEKLQNYTDKVGVSVLYDTCMKDGGERDDEDIEEKMEHLEKAGIAMSKIE
jgi:hypothetical protein